MREIQILDEVPVIFTKDRFWVQKQVKLQPGAIILLPDDAVLLLPHQEVHTVVTDLQLDDLDTTKKVRSKASSELEKQREVTE